MLRRFTLGEMNEIFEIRTLLEPAAAAAASAHAGPKGLADMKAPRWSAPGARTRTDIDGGIHAYQLGAAHRWAWLTMVPNRELAEGDLALHHF